MTTPGGGNESEWVALTLSFSFNFCFFDKAKKKTKRHTAMLRPKGQACRC